MNMKINNFMMRKLLIAFLFTVICIGNANAQDKNTFWLGADISGTTQLESNGEKLYNTKGEIRENTALMKELGLNAVRLRVWVNPRGGWSGAEDVLEMAKRAKYYDMAVMIDFHYSDWWADPGKQDVPAAWQYMSYDEMKNALSEHTEDVLSLLKKNGIDVKWVQVGNETTNGFLWPMGRASDNMEKYAGFTDAGYQAVKKIYPNAQVIIHLDGGCDQKRYDFIFDGLKKYGAHYDMIGLSVYPYWDVVAKLESDWKGTVRDFTANVKHLYEKYGKETMVVETGAEAKHPKDGYKIMKAVINAAKNDCGGHCHGVFYWAPELEGQYQLGAFDNHRPTEIMKAFAK
jgi:arabinogalactan endo-1,4-beta-galactosidase